MIANDRDIASLLAAASILPYTAATAGGANDNTVINGDTQVQATVADAYQSVPLSACVIAVFEATIDAAETAAVTAVIESSDGGTFTGDDLETLVTATATLEATGAQRLAIPLPINLSGVVNWRVTMKTNLSRANTDTARMYAVAAYGGFQELPAPRPSNVTYVYATE